MKILDTEAWVASLACSALAGGAPAPLIRLPRTWPQACSFASCWVFWLPGGRAPSPLSWLAYAVPGRVGRVRPQPCAPVLAQRAAGLPAHAPCCARRAAAASCRIPPGSRRAVCVCAAVGSSCVVCSLGRCALRPPSLPSCWYPPRVFPGGPACDLTWRTIPVPAGRRGPAVAGRGVLRRQRRPGRPWCRAGPRPY